MARELPSNYRSGARRRQRAGYGRGLRNPETTFPALVRGIIGMLYFGFGLFLMVKPTIFQLPAWQVIVGGAMLVCFGGYRLWMAYKVAYSPMTPVATEDELISNEEKDSPSNPTNHSNEPTEATQDTQ